ncbi:CDP-diacylglycerol--glycerol-3-phosphate 3-phosphatidyltransferase [Rasamsonia emersonii CBS 393.64]|uniref:CDP-diacylglycerol--glycerol-3-phosphate 3-phosphatidyltransferase n=1 Tax=Rasamsonia emersonii (strain ATCC 16479 / CBS 393.64 / IMI 116815) TaxID=1408163 RepID=A0A0F4YVK0_RASE3|nr:CDP-diacylglycerol--glycerol-3-phosphate 3-phosphatidyltransferase [Rasamsonia emersonii CBS 393.64]KKA21881.1 CDP-diacylglycerol--glycerol-3-phosphate 3-phosphatidyltransferase [Rasamsonia emersonii CBS 393.64]
MLKRVGEHALRCTPRRPVIRRKLSARKFSVYTSSSASATSTASPLGGLTVELDRIAPRFEVPASKITILDSPSSFYQTLKDKIKNAKRRIYLSTLYIGKTEFELVETLNQALRNNPDLKVSILTDALRGTRETPNPSCASLLASLVAEHGTDRVEIRMFHTPNLTGLRKKLIPRRINEGWGLQHMKLYGIDDEIILSGSKELTDYYARIHHAVCSLSFQVLPDANSVAGYDLVWPTSNGSSSPLESPEGFISHASSVLGPLIQPSKSAPIPSSSSSQTLVYPVAQFTPLLKPDTSTEFLAVSSILRLLANSPNLQDSRWLFTAGYFNIHPILSSLLIGSTSLATKETAKTQGTVLTASPWANGFYGSPGVSGMLPAAYTHLSARFLDKVAEAQRTNAIQLKEWRRGTVGEPGGWTYHAKGLWITLPREEYPSLTFVGSSNYTKRSYSLDLEVGALVITSDEALKKRLGEETEWLQKDARPISREDLRRTERRVGWNVRLAMWIVEKVGGAL